MTTGTISASVPGHGVVLYRVSRVGTTTRYEAENATFTTGSTVDRDWSCYSGAGFVNTPNATGSFVQWTVNAAVAGPAALVFDHANGTTTNRPMDITLNGTLVANDLAFNGTGAWSLWRQSIVNVNLAAGANTIRATGVTAGGAPNMDYLGVAAPTSTPVTEYQAEDALIIQGVVESNHAGFTGTGFVNGDNVIGSGVEWTVNAATAGAVTVAIRFANGTTANRPMDIFINGVLVRDEQAFNPTGAWTTWDTVSFTATLNAGTNTIRALATTVSGGPNLDRLTV
jgi:alpha-galactosidase